MIKLKILSLFANIGVAEAYLDEMGHEVVVANELDRRRATLYQKIYPKTKMICGDITDKTTFNIITELSKESGVNCIMATPPCQGMRTAGRQNKVDVQKLNRITGIVLTILGVIIFNVYIYCIM